MRELFYLLVFLLLLGCTRHPESMETDNQISADSLIPREQMVRITADVHVVEAALLNKKYDRKNKRTLAAHYYKALFSKYRISELRYRQNIDRLQKDTRDFMEFYKEVIAELDVRIDSAQKVLAKSTEKK